MRAQASRRVLVYVWDTCLRLLHPFMPFLTEALWQLIPHSGDSIMVADWPQLEDSEALPLDHTAGTTQYSTVQYTPFNQNCYNLVFTNANTH